MPSRNKFLRLSLLVVIGFFVLVAVFYFSHPANAKDTPAKPTKELMGQFLEQMDALKKYNYSDEKFTAPENDAKIRSHLKQLSRLAHEAGHDPLLKQNNYKLSKDVLINHIDDTEKVFAVGNKYYARWMLNSTLSVCMSCHSQFPTSSRELKDFEVGKSFTDDYSQAEFLFATRAFDKASRIFDRLILAYPKGNLEAIDLEKALQRQIGYYARIKRDPKGAIKALSQYEKNKDIPEHLAKDIVAWKAQFELWHKSKDLDARTATEEQILLLAETNLPTHEPYSVTPVLRPVQHMRVSSILYEYLQTHPQTKIVPELLYYLSVYDRTLNNNFFYSLANLYLRECIVEHPAHAFAEKCFYEYEAEIISSYSGPQGTRVPPEVKKDLKDLQKMIDPKGKKLKPKL